LGNDQKALIEYKVGVHYLSKGVPVAAANRFLLRLEQTGLFSKVTLLDTTREPFFDKNAIAFRLECALNPSPPAEAPAAGATARGGE